MTDDDRTVKDGGALAGDPGSPAGQAGETGPAAPNAGASAAPSGEAGRRSGRRDRRTLGDRLMMLILGLLAGGGLLWGYTQYLSSHQATLLLENGYQRAFQELLTHVETTSALTGKALVAVGPRQTASLYGDIWRSAYAAQLAAAQLPLDMRVQGRLSEFLNQLGDYASVLYRRAAGGSPVTAKDWQQMQRLYGQARSLTAELASLNTAMMGGRFRWLDLAGRYAWGGTRPVGMGAAPEPGPSTPAARMVSDGFSRLNKQLEGFPKPAYDGPFSDTVLNRKPRGLTGRDVSSKEALQAAQAFTKGVLPSTARLTVTGQGNGVIPVYFVTAVGAFSTAGRSATAPSAAPAAPGAPATAPTQGRGPAAPTGRSPAIANRAAPATDAVPAPGAPGTAPAPGMAAPNTAAPVTAPTTDVASNIFVSRRGGKVVSMVSPRPVAAARISLADAENRAAGFVRSHGYPNMVPTYTLRRGNTAIVTFADQDRGVIVYPDQVKAQVALDNGDILGLDAATYWMNHHVRSAAALVPRISQDEARHSLNPQLQAGPGKLALIPTDDGREVLCWEFRGRLGGTEYLVYINADNGDEEKILEVVRSRDGTMTM
ncbi:MAG: germination protein YpeB [Firmicutes bacterium]|nr:germination protein YpeB [Bacillota bacterium]